MNPAGVPAPTAPLAPVRHRRNAALLTAQQLQDVRSAIAASQQISDDRGYQYWAGIHGLPLPISCTHHTHLFLPWHRAYLYFFEKNLQDRVPGVTLPWWNWIGASALPPPYAAAQAEQGTSPLYDSPIQASGRRTPNRSTPTQNLAGEAPQPQRAPTGCPSHALPGSHAEEPEGALRLPAEEQPSA
jgi:hypothetical protein